MRRAVALTLMSVNGSDGIMVSKILKFLYSSLLCDGQGADRQAILFGDRSC